jgi:ribosome-binding protein aMBF1 (putative translation factor)
MKNYKKLKQQLLKDNQTNEVYKKIGPEFELIRLIIEKRLNQGLTQAELAKKLNTKQSSISRLESGDYNPSLAFLNRLAKALDAKLYISIS